MCRRADERGPRPGERLRTPRAEIRPPTHRVLELGAVRLDREGRPGCGPDGPAEQHVVDEHELGGQPLAHRSCVRLDPSLELLAGAVGDAANVVEALVAVDDERGQEPRHVRPRRRRPAEVVRLGVRLLAEHGHVVPGARSTPARAAACRRSSRCRRAGTRARAGCASAHPAPVEAERTERWDRPDVEEPFGSSTSGVRRLPRPPARA